ncbi:MAG: hemerythrin domain-containing protein [Magnetococcus sp. DMHC-1]|nr:hemerythrin domain-containing protein [Magnetococcales bacterium]
MKYQFLPERILLGHPEIDFQHEMLFFVMTGLQRLVKKSGGRDEGIDFAHLESIFKLIEDYTATHFAYEEELMQTSHYQDVSNHAMEHRQFENTMIEFAEKFVTLDDNLERVVLAKRILDFLYEWVNTHIALSDRRFFQTMPDRKT